MSAVVSQHPARFSDASVANTLINGPARRSASRKGGKAPATMSSFGKLTNGRHRAPIWERQRVAACAPEGSEALAAKGKGESHPVATTYDGEVRERSPP